MGDLHNEINRASKSSDIFYPKFSFFRKKKGNDSSVCVCVRERERERERELIEKNNLFPCDI